MEITRIPGEAQGRSRIVIHKGIVWTVATADGDNVAEQTRNCLKKIEANLIEAGSRKDLIIEATVYLEDMATKAGMDAVWCEWIPENGWPCRACVGTTLYPGDLVEIKLSAAQA